MNWKTTYNIGRHPTQRRALQSDDCARLGQTCSYGAERDRSEPERCLQVDIDPAVTVLVRKLVLQRVVLVEVLTSGHELCQGAGFLRVGEHLPERALVLARGDAVQAGVEGAAVVRVDEARVLLAQTVPVAEDVSGAGEAVDGGFDRTAQTVGLLGPVTRVRLYVVDEAGSALGQLRLVVDAQVVVDAVILVGAGEVAVLTRARRRTIRCLESLSLAVCHPVVDAGVGGAPRPLTERQAIVAVQLDGNAVVTVPVLVALVRVGEVASPLRRRAVEAGGGESRWADEEAHE